MTAPAATHSRWPAIRALAGLSAAFLVTFVVQRHTSALLLVEGRADVARAVATARGEPVALVMALHYVRGGALTAGELQAVVQRFQALRTEFGSSTLAAVALDDVEVSRRMLAEHGSAAAAEAAARHDRSTLAAVRLEEITDRLQARGW